MDRTYTTGSSPDPRPAVAPERIVLTGFMGSGKTTIGRRVAERLGWRFIDLDSVIEQRDGRTVAAIFAESGEADFRAMESDALASLLKESQIVVALGGGALETNANRQALASSSKIRTVFLTASFDTLYDRCLHQTGLKQIESPAESALPVRPLLGDREAAATRLARRAANYRQAAHLVLDTTGQEPEQSVDTLLELLRSTL